MLIKRPKMVSCSSHPPASKQYTCDNEILPTSVGKHQLPGAGSDRSSHADMDTWVINACAEHHLPVSKAAKGYSLEDVACS
jgi:hypothetical protein